MKPLRSLLATALALAACAFTLQAEVVPILDDTVGAVSPGGTTLTSAGGAAKTLAISLKSTAFIRFATADTGILPSEVAAARVTIYFASVAKPGSVAFWNIGSDFTESFPERSRPAPTLAPTGVISAAAVKGQYLTIDVTNMVRTGWPIRPPDSASPSPVAMASSAPSSPAKKGRAAATPRSSRSIAWKTRLPP